jgi:hypothetical protein
MRILCGKFWENGGVRSFGEIKEADAGFERESVAVVRRFC